MTERAAEKRVNRTKRLIRDTLTELIEEKGFEGVTVRDLTERAKINRGTFYLHYRDKYDLLEQSEDEIIKGIVQLVHEISPIEAVAYTSQNEPFPIIQKLFEHFQENANFMKVILGPKGDPAFQVKLRELITETFLNKMAEEINSEEMQVPVEFLTTYVSAAHVGVIQHWLETGMEKSPREMTLILAKMTLLGPGHVAGLKK
ncbi:TetR/AcrR family transcriptional regulator [Neobacillus mesonae]|uniref:TetR family transcriptional regulator n=1 Tax=Neobacillus mesonae TaxID=1193713 RepID=A0A3T0I3P5_9BACI|nr:TetR/AcrR family transcriptional regulator [Neobacillus mesonae]AZU63950.1 TetR family transcriptional regulator [Neobacillus mesonae]